MRPRAELRALGICTTCGRRKAAAGRATCRKCRTAIASSRACQRFSKALRGECVRCLNPVVPGYVECSDCRLLAQIRRADPEHKAQVRLRVAQYRARQKPSGI